MWDEDVIEAEAPAGRHGRGAVIDLDDLDDGRCKATTWGPARSKLPAKPTYENYFGPGGFNRCIGSEGHANPLHKDEWGHVFRVNDDKCRVVRREER